MTDDKIKQLFEIADRTAGRPLMFPVKTGVIRRRARRKRVVGATSRVAAAVLIFAVALWGLSDRSTRPTAQQRQIASLQAQVKLLQARTDAALKLIEEVLDEERRQGRLAELEAELASIPEPLDEIKKQVDRAAFTLVYEADRMYGELNKRHSAVRAYKRVIELYPQTQSAEIARQRLSEIEGKERKKRNSEGDLIWKPRNVQLSC